MTPTRLALVAYTLALGVIIVDQITKAWMLFGLHLREVGQILVLDPWFNLSFVLNRGVSFGLLTGGETGRWLLTAFSIIVAGGLAWWARRADRPLLALALGSVIGGALGNVIDRIRFGGVVDFLDFSGIGFPWVFNVADSAISIGVVLLILDSLLSERRAKQQADAAKRRDDAAASVGAAPEKS
ncbi:signal peptidase II [Brevundimonas lutea]|uniref:signal peptidase II n=1 Tax=Brevundimonas lutea TaxID=2293980 RepID=UPI000F0449BE|nr:signal peptidase II [Brevundimonas lutea]